MKPAVFNENPESCILTSAHTVVPLFLCFLFYAGAALWNEFAKSVYILGFSVCFILGFFFIVVVNLAKNKTKNCHSWLPKSASPMEIIC